MYANKILLVLFLSITMLPASTIGQTNADEPADDGSGLFISAGLLGTNWTSDDLEIDDSGGGFLLQLGYSFNANVAIYANLDASTIDPDQGPDYGLGHFDLGLEVRSGDVNTPFRFFGRASYLGFGAVEENDSGDIEITGNGFGLGGGVYYFPIPQFSLGLSYTRSFVTLTEINVAGNTTEIDENVQSGRFALSATYHF